MKAFSAVLILSLSFSGVASANSDSQEPKNVAANGFVIYDDHSETPQTSANNEAQNQTAQAQARAAEALTESARAQQATARAQEALLPRPPAPPTPWHKRSVGMRVGGLNMVAGGLTALIGGVQFGAGVVTKPFAIGWKFKRTLTLGTAVAASLIAVEHYTIAEKGTSYASRARASFFNNGPGAVQAAEEALATAEQKTRKAIVSRTGRAYEFGKGKVVEGYKTIKQGTATRLQKFKPATTSNRFQQFKSGKRFSTKPAKFKNSSKKKVSRR